MVRTEAEERAPTSRVVEQWQPRARTERDTKEQLALPFGARVWFPDGRRARLAAVCVDPASQQVTALELSRAPAAEGRAVPVHAVAEVAADGIRVSDLSGFLRAGRRSEGTRLTSNQAIVGDGDERAAARLKGVVVARQDWDLVALLVSRHRWGQPWRLPRDQIVELGPPAVRVRPGATALARLARYRSDEDILIQVTRVIQQERTLLARDWEAVQASVADGVVRIRGNVRTSLMRRGIIEAVKRVPGVLATRDELVEDRDLEIAVASALAGDPRTRALNLYVCARLGEVQVAGGVSGPEVAGLAIAAVSAVPGVRSVRSALVWPGGESGRWG